MQACMLNKCKATIYNTLSTIMDKSLWDSYAM